MTCWHEIWCTAPDISVDPNTNTPRCARCLASPNLVELAASVAGFSPSPSLPPDQPLDDMQLDWPRAPRFQFEPEEGHERESTIYQRRLRPNELCLIRLPSTGRMIDAPIHFHLEVCQEDCFPDYEATSYAWGGEEGDSTLCKPVFIGDFWDVSFQTKNCWSMLKTFRHRRGDRILWVDAICINQSDVEEQEKVQHTFELPDTSKYAFHNLARCEYFRRLWVVQELIAARRWLVRVGITDYELVSGYLDFGVDGVEEKLKASAAPCLMSTGDSSNPTSKIFAYPDPTPITLASGTTKSTAIQRKQMDGIGRPRTRRISKMVSPAQLNSVKPLDS
ncbi:hypothetical protein QBC35DRAFT_526213 [Podospora australis]|uniref:Heterokaryon incompatibility domain-containing protein n=1 Tax=Podospora australis TaxID=1536484 RepID=A0AAN6WKE4_9PEZI|nr:hypothetical protein QBC35DRAFT_526213 [Podospora australis]